jgi:hypothetical protein
VPIDKDAEYKHLTGTFDGFNESTQKVTLKRSSRCLGSSSWENNISSATLHRMSTNGGQTKIEKP